ncbi:hypothetical protein PC129_g20829 [Phytophthora cactorum]|uniref:Transposase Tc1-like domain-containing protein n=1 Tax=Phytophthora cactorum TaxID=29920 RepID=A0A8T1CA01_9STRA|nr:hypothetical protein PC114_g23881 [Phytophthora cactorum]KAG2917719.1 hypothetical protein PC117_g17337 [Phytophthora cactorum]KAG2989527.1 hypothetical protein PC120_g23140 [Phytophthora cactorum]KAG3129481.1 hypothetical protein C6341_g24105 [Phytophthora cactorum]KAG3208144.1 hypothetical protein PC129_g20829 [Phytophthora cactorum]
MGLTFTFTSSHPHEYSHDLRCRVVQKWRAKVSTRTISKELLIPQWSVRTIIDFYKANGRCTPPPRPGRTPLTDARQDRRIVRAVEANRFVSAAVVAARVTSDIGVNVSPEVVRARVRAAGLHGRSARKKPFLSRKHRRQRLRYAQKFLDWPEKKWRTVLFSDEASVELHGTAGTSGWYKWSLWRQHKQQSSHIERLLQ